MYNERINEEFTMKKREMKELVSTLSVVEIEKLLNILATEMRERYSQENPNQELYTINDLEQMEPYSELAH
jgi:hypothetical protein